MRPNTTSTRTKVLKNFLFGRHGVVVVVVVVEGGVLLSSGEGAYYVGIKANLTEKGSPATM